MPKSELITAFEKCKKEGRPSLLTYQVAGDPNKKKSFDILKSISKSADVCEWGLAHSANVGDGRQIQDATFRVIKNKFKIKDAFEIMGLKSNTDWSTVQKKFKTLVKKFHPDKNLGNKKYEDKLKKITLAYSHLKMIVLNKK